MSKLPERPRPRAARRFLPAALILGAALLAYAPVFHAGFVWDDNTFLTANRLIRAPDGLYRFWFTAAPSDYFPLTSSMLWFEWRLWGQSAAGYHVVNVLLHAASAVLLWRVLLRLRVPGAWLAGMLFALHPVAAASAAWISERKNTLSMLFCLGSILAYLRFDVRTHHDDPLFVAPLLRRAKNNTAGTTNGNPQSAIRNPHYYLSLGLFLLALLSKSSVVMLPVILLILAWWRRGKIVWKDLLRTAPFFALSLALGLVTIWFQRHNAIGQEVVRAEGAASRVAAAGWIAWFYLYKILLPVRLCAVYPRWEVDGSSLLSWLPLALLLAATALLWINRKRWGAGPLAAWASFVIMLLPVLGFVDMSFMRLSLVADHLQYAAMPGILALAAALLARATAGARGGRPAAVAAAVAVGICLAALGALTYQRAEVFTSNQRLWRDNAGKTPRSARIWSELGMAYVNAGALDEAIVSFDQALELDPKYSRAWLERGIARADAHRYADALGDYDQAIALKPDDPDAWYNRSNAWFETGHPAEALRDLDQAIALRPDYAEAYVNRGLIHAAANRPAEAMSDYNQAIAVNPDCAEAYVNRGLLHAAAHQPAEAMSDYKQAIAVNPDCVEAWYNRGTAYARAGRLGEALRDLDEAIARKPDYADAWYNRANAYLAAGRPADAIGDLDRLIALRPREARAYYQRGVANQRLKQDREALADFQMARQLGAKLPEELLRSLSPAAQPSR